jgi:hypothetical protein
MPPEDTKVSDPIYWADIKQSFATKKLHPLMVTSEGYIDYCKVVKKYNGPGHKPNVELKPVLFDKLFVVKNIARRLKPIARLPKEQLKTLLIEILEELYNDR